MFKTIAVINLAFFPIIKPRVATSCLGYRFGAVYNTTNFSLLSAFERIAHLWKYSCITNYMIIHTARLSIAMRITNALRSLTAIDQGISLRRATAATRSLLTTARMMDNNPTLLRLKEIEAVERIAERGEKLTVYDGFKKVTRRIVSFTQ